MKRANLPGRGGSAAPWRTAARGDAARALGPAGHSVFETGQVILAAVPTIDQGGGIFMMEAARSIHQLVLCRWCDGLWRMMGGNMRRVK